MRVSKQFQYLMLCTLAIARCSNDAFYSPSKYSAPTEVFQGLPYVESSDSFSARFAQQTDILLVIDNSGSMSQERDAVKASIANFHTNLNARRSNDYRFALVTTDAHSHEGRLVSKDGTGTDIVTSALPDPVSSVRSLLDAVTNSATSYWEQGLKSSELAITLNRDRFLRPGVELAVVLISDEEDYSCVAADGSPSGRECPGFNVNSAPENMNPRPWQPVPLAHYEAFYRGLGRGVLLFPIVGTPDRRCEEQSKGLRYLALQTLLGVGAPAPLCNADLPANFAQVASRISARGDCYRLTKEAAPGGASLVVTVNGTAVAPSVAPSTGEGYTFDQASNSVCFPGSVVPPAGAAISVTYLGR